MEQVRVKALKGFTEFVRGVGMVVFNGPREADDKRGIKARKGTEAELPLALAQERQDRGYVEVVGKGKDLVDKNAPGARREKRLAARESRRALATGDGGGLGRIVDEDEIDGELRPASEDYAEARADADAQPGDGATDVVSDGLTTQTPSGTATGTADDLDGELSTETRDTVGDGASAVVGAEAFDHDGDGKVGGSKPRGRGRPAAKKADEAPKGGSTETPSDAPAE